MNKTNRINKKREVYKMDYLEKAEQQIRKEWFKDHVATLTGKKGLQVLHWAKPGTFMYATKYVLSENNVFVSGDTGEAVYVLTEQATLESIKTYDLSYFTGKLEAYRGERWDFDMDLAIKELNEYWVDCEENEENKETYDKIVEAIQESNGNESFHCQITSAYNGGGIHSDDMEWIWHLGERLPYRLIGYWVGLQMAAEQLLEKKNQTS